MLNLNLTPIQGNHDLPLPAEEAPRQSTVARHGSDQPQSAAGRMMKLLTGACLLTSVAAGRALQAPIGGQNLNLLLQNGRRTLTNGQDLAQFRQELQLSTTARLSLGQAAGRTLAANSKEKKMTKIHHKKATHHTPSATEAKRKAKPAPSSAAKKTSKNQTAAAVGMDPIINSRQKSLLQINNNLYSTNLSLTSSLSQSLPVVQKLISDVTSILDAEAKDLSLKKAPNGPQMLGTHDLLEMSGMIDASIHLIAENAALTPHTQQQMTEARKSALILQDLKLKAAGLALNP